MKLLTVGNPKTIKGEKQGFLTFILHFAPAKLSGYEVCPKATEGCRAACLNTAGRGGMFKRGETTNVIQEARKRKTKMFFEQREEFMALLVKDIQAAVKMAERKGLTPVFRLNGTSDIAWEKMPVGDARNIFEVFPNVRFYDYTKMLNRKVQGIKNYSLTFSRADGNEKDVVKAFEQGMNVAAVFDVLPNEYFGKPVIDGDESDLRLLDPKGVVVGLKAKGKAKKDTSGFVVFLKKI